jgi:hypothetical protein
MSERAPCYACTCPCEDTDCVIARRYAATARKTAAEKKPPQKQVKTLRYSVVKEDLGP